MPVIHRTYTAYSFLVRDQLKECNISVGKGEEIMFYTILWLVIWLLIGNTTFTFGTGGTFWSLLVALFADLFFYGYVRRQPWYIK